MRKKRKVFWWHPRLMDYRRPLFDLAVSEWQVHFFLLHDPGAELDKRARATVARRANPVAMRPWLVPWAEVNALWNGVRESDVVITSFLWNSYTLYLLLFAWVLRKPVTVWEERSKEFPTLVGRLQSTYYRVVRRLVSSFFTLGEVQKVALMTAGVPESLIFVSNEYPGLIYSNVVPQPFDLPGKDAAHRILFLGRLIPFKGVDVLIRAFSILRRINPDLVLLVVGDGPESAALQALSHELEVAEQTFFLGAISDPARKSYLLHQCAVMAVPSVTTKGQMEGGPLVVLEALSAGLPVVSSTSIGSSERFVVDQDARLAVPEGSAEALAAALQLVLNNGADFKERAILGFSKIPDHGNQFAVLQRAIDFK